MNLFRCHVTVHCYVSDCRAGFFGEACAVECNCKDKKEVCNPFNGSCHSGCPDRYIGVNCLQTVCE